MGERAHGGTAGLTSGTADVSCRNRPFATFRVEASKQSTVEAFAVADALVAQTQNALRRNCRGERPKAVVGGAQILPETIHGAERSLSRHGRG